MRASCAAWLQIDVMEHAAIMDVVILETVLEEVKHLSTSSYTRLRALIAKPERRFFVLLNEHHRCGVPVFARARVRRWPSS